MMIVVFKTLKLFFLTFAVILGIVNFTCTHVISSMIIQAVGSVSKWQSAFVLKFKSVFLDRVGFKH